MDEIRSLAESIVSQRTCEIDYLRDIISTSNIVWDNPTKKLELKKFALKKFAFKTLTLKTFILKKMHSLFVNKAKTTFSLLLTRAVIIYFLRKAYLPS